MASTQVPPPGSPHPLAASRHLSSQLPGSPASARLAREMVRQVTGDPENARVALVVTELVTNAVSHAGSAPVFAVDWDGGRVRVEVTDDDPTPPVVRQVDATATSGRGMALVAAVADRWGVDAASPGKTVWAEIRPGTDPVD